MVFGNRKAIGEAAIISNEPHLNEKNMRENPSTSEDPPMHHRKKGKS
jgi:hypothetical protein